MPRIAVFCEDKYGEPFLKKLAALLKSNNVMDNGLGLDSHMFYRPCNPKLSRQLSIMSSEQINKFIILVDSDGKDKLQIRARVDIHIPKSLKQKTVVIVFDYEIEDWICAGIGEAINGRTAAILQKKHGYEKHQLPSYVAKIDLQKMMTCQTFAEFVECLN